MLLTMCRRACRAGALVEVAGQHLDGLVDLGALVLVSAESASAAFPSARPATRSTAPAKVINEIERVFDLMGDAGGQLAQGGHLFRLDQTGLRGLETR